MTELRRLVAPLRTSKAVAAVRAAQAVLLAGLQRRCPVGKTHALYRSIHETAVGSGPSSVGGGVVVGTNHAIPVEFGSIQNRAHPFVRPTAAIDGPRAEQAMEKVLKS